MQAAGGIACLARLCSAQTLACSGASDMRHDSLQQSAASALRAIAIEADGKVGHACFLCRWELSLIEQQKAMLPGSMFRSQYHAGHTRMILRSVAKLLRTCQAAHNNRCADRRQEAVGAGAAQALARLLAGPDAGAVAAAAAALRNVAQHPRARQALAAELATVPAAQKVAQQDPCAARAVTAVYCSTYEQ